MSPDLQGLGFHEFARERQVRLTRDNALLDAANTQLYHTLPRVDPKAFAPIAASVDPRSKHRCHLAEAFCQYLELDETKWKPRALVSQGVRDSLGIMMRQAAEQRSTLWLPTDVYPVYLELAAQAGGAVQPYSARDGLDLDALEGHRNWTVLLCDPLKPWGGAMDKEQRDLLVAMAKRCGGKILVDGAYVSGFPHAWREFIERDEPVALLLSVSKGWLLPYRGGVVIAGDQFSSSWKSAFASSRCNPDGLRQAFAALVEHADRPARVTAVVDQSRQDMLAVMTHRGIALDDPGHGYLVASRQDVDRLAAQGVLAVPASVFGCRQGGCVLSSIGWARPPA